MMLNYYSIEKSMEIATEKGETFKDFDKSDYANGTYFEKYETTDYSPVTEKVQQLFEGIHIPTKEDWTSLKEQVQRMVYTTHIVLPLLQHNQSVTFKMQLQA